MESESVTNWMLRFIILDEFALLAIATREWPLWFVAQNIWTHPMWWLPIAALWSFVLVVSVTGRRIRFGMVKGLGVATIALSLQWVVICLIQTDAIVLSDGRKDFATAFALSYTLLISAVTLWAMFGRDAPRATGYLRVAGAVGSASLLWSLVYSAAWAHRQHLEAVVLALLAALTLSPNSDLWHSARPAVSRSAMIVVVAVLGFEYLAVMLPGEDLMTRLAIMTAVGAASGWITVPVGNGLNEASG